MSKTKKRTELWADYFNRLASKLGIASFGTFTFLIGLVGALTTLGISLLGLVGVINGDIRLSADTFVEVFLSVLFAGFIGGISMVAIYYGIKIFKEAKEINVAHLPTYRNLAASLPAEDVLVRASAEPTEEAGKTLLRGAMKDGETPMEELLRPLWRC